MFLREPMFELARKWAYFLNGRIESILTTVPLTFGWGNAIGIAGVATRLSSRGSGLANDLLKEVLRQSALRNEGPALLFAKRTELYEAAGFRLMDRVVRAPIESSGGEAIPGVLSMDEVVQIYNDWSLSHPNRLRRGEQRWNYWKWNLRICSPFSSGYLCLEGPLIRECILDDVVPKWPVHQGSEWVGLESMAQRLRIPINDPHFELHLMGHGFDQPPQMFMTDQF